MVVGGGIRTEREPFSLGRFAKVIQHASRLYRCQASADVDPVDGTQVLRGVDHHSVIAALPGETGATATVEDRHFVMPADLDGQGDIIYGPWDNDSDRRLAIVRGIRRIRRDRGWIESDLPSDGGAQLSSQGGVWLGERPRDAAESCVDDARRWSPFPASRQLPATPPRTRQTVTVAAGRASFEFIDAGSEGVAVAGRRTGSPGIRADQILERASPWRTRSRRSYSLSA